MENNFEHHSLPSRESVYHLNVAGEMRSALHKPVYTDGPHRMNVNGIDRITLNGTDRIIVNGTDRIISNCADPSHSITFTREHEMCEDAIILSVGEREQESMEEMLKGWNAYEACNSRVLLDHTNGRGSLPVCPSDEESVVENETNVELLADADNGNNFLAVREENAYNLNLTVTDQEGNNRIHSVTTNVWDGIEGERFMPAEGGAMNTANHEKDLAIGFKNAGQIFRDEIVRRLGSDMEALRITDEAMDVEPILINDQDSAKAERDEGGNKSIVVDHDRPDSPMSTMSSLFGRSPSPDAPVPPTVALKKLNYTLHNNRITVLATDALASRRPLHHPVGRKIEPDGSFKFFERIPLSHQISKQWRKCLGTFIAKHVLKLKVNADDAPLMLSRFPDDYVLYMLKSGTTMDEMNAEVSYYLYGSKYVNHFRSPMEFGQHLKWLMKGMPMRGSGKGGPTRTRGQRGTRCCFCVHCRDDGVSQMDIKKKYFGRRVAKKRKDKSDMLTGRNPRRCTKGNRDVDLSKAKDYRSAGVAKVVGIAQAM